MSFFHHVVISLQSFVSYAQTFVFVVFIGLTHLFCCFSDALYVSLVIALRGRGFTKGREKVQQLCTLLAEHKTPHQIREYLISSYHHVVLSSYCGFVAVVAFVFSNSCSHCSD